jgi:hypothetical protein
MSRVRRWLTKWARTTHVYLTLFGLVLILFFAVTGFMLNHDDWFNLSTYREKKIEGTIPTAHLQPVNQLAVVEALRARFGAVGQVQTFTEDEDTLEVVFIHPGHQVVVRVKRADGATEANHELYGTASLLTDLHKGKAKGVVWSAVWIFVIDAVCVLLLVICVTGLILWSSLKSRARYGAVIILLGGVVAAAVYWWFVP